MLSQGLVGIIVPDKQVRLRDPNCTHVPRPHPQLFLQALYIPDVGQLLKSHNEDLDKGEWRLDTGEWTLVEEKTALGWCERGGAGLESCV